MNLSEIMILLLLSFMKVIMIDKILHNYFDNIDIS